MRKVRLPSIKPKIYVALRLPGEILEEVDTIATYKNMRRSQVLRRAVALGLRAFRDKVYDF